MPCLLIELAAASCSSLLSYFHYTIGNEPLDMNWDDAKSKETVDNDPKFIKSVKEIQTFVSKLSK
jgi:hypothetical protein